MHCACTHVRMRMTCACPPCAHATLRLTCARPPTLMPYSMCALTSCRCRTVRDMCARARNPFPLTITCAHAPYINAPLHVSCVREPYIHITQCRITYTHAADTYPRQAWNGRARPTCLRQWTLPARVCPKAMPHCTCHTRSRPTTISYSSLPARARYTHSPLSVSCARTAYIYAV